MSDEGLHEIQLNGKQLVFLFMAATVVAVVVFLCGVMVGRGVPARPGALSDIPQQAAGVDPTAAAQRQGAPPAISSTDNSLPAGAEDLSYTRRLEESNASDENLTPAAEATVATVPLPTPLRTPPPTPPPPIRPEPPRATAKPVAPLPRKPEPRPPAAPKPEPPRAAAQPAAPVPAVPVPTVPVRSTPEKPVAVGTVLAEPLTAPLTEPSGGGFVVQVAAVRTRADAEAIARRLTTRGYPAFITTSGANFRVRVGKFNDRSEAATVAGRLQREEQFKPWITR